MARFASLMFGVVLFAFGSASSQPTASACPSSAEEAANCAKIYVSQAAISTPKDRDEERSSYFDVKFIPHGNSSYFFGLLTLDWNAADKACKELGAHLVAVESYSEDLFITKHILEIAKVYPDVSGYYIGAKRQGTTAKWMWTPNGQQVNYFRWGPTEPAESPNSGADCIVYWKNHPLFWNWGDIHCSHRASFICEKDMKNIK